MKHWPSCGSWISFPQLRRNTINQGEAIGMDQKATARYERPSITVMDEEELLKVFQMTAAEISVASCWWGGCPTGCP